MSSRYFKTGKVTCCFAGDGAYANGVVLEALNWAAMGQFTDPTYTKNAFGLPIVYAVINNHYGFTGRIDGLIELVPDYDGPTPPDATYYATYRNVDRVDREGLEWEASYQTRLWGVRTSFEMLDQTDAATGEKTPFAYADKIQVGLSLRPFGPDFTFTTTVEHWLPPEQNPKTLVSGGTTYTYVDDDYTLVGASFVWRPTRSGLKWFDDSVEVRLGATNLFNGPRLNASNVSTSARVGLGRNIYLSLTKRF
jgi:hypothetical protein